MERLQSRVQELFGDGNLKVVEEPYIPSEPSRPNVVLNMMIAGMLAILFCPGNNLGLKAQVIMNVILLNLIGYFIFYFTHYYFNSTKIWYNRQAG